MNIGPSPGFLGALDGDAPTEAFDEARVLDWTEVLERAAQLQGLQVSRDSIDAATLARESAGDATRGLRDLAGQLRLGIEEGSTRLLRNVAQWRLPLIIEFDDARLAVLEEVDDHAGLWTLSMVGDAGQSRSLERDRCLSQVRRVVVARPLEQREDARVDEYVKPYREHWFREIVMRDARAYGHVFLASLFANTLALAGLVFVMQVYDRVIPAESFPTLYVLFTGVVIALLFEFSLRVSRVRLIDVLGRRADLRISDRVFGHALRIRNDARPSSTGTFIAQLRELERIREFMTSSTVALLADMPFFLLFVGVFWYLAGWLVLVPVVALGVMILPGLLAQRELNRLAHSAIREASLRNAILIESVQGNDEIKLMQSEQMFHRQWNQLTRVGTDVNLRLRFLTNSIATWGQSVQSATFATVVLFGAPMVMTGDLTTGVLVAASILASRMLAPMTQLNQVISRWQHARVALEGLDQIMQRPSDRPSSQPIRRERLEGAYNLRGAEFRYSIEDKRTALRVERLDIRPGERIAVLGRNGSGKSTLLAGLAGLLPVHDGEMQIDNVPIGQLDPLDIRRDVTYLPQQGRLFHGTVRENLRLARPTASDADILAALQRAGAERLLRTLPEGLDYLIREGGAGLSGGQRQSLLLARTFLRDARVLLLDEPTSGLDDPTEARILATLRGVSSGTGWVVATHRRALVNLADRVLVLEQGRIVLDGPREEVLEKLLKNSATGTRAKAPTARARTPAAGVARKTVARSKANEPKANEPKANEPKANEPKTSGGTDKADRQDDES